MNTKGIKFLAVLAVLVMAFAAIAVVAPAETDDAEVEAPTKAYKSPGSSTLDTAAVVSSLSDTTVLKYYAASSTSITATGSNYIVYVLMNATTNVKLTITSLSDSATVQVIPVTVDSTDTKQLVASSGITLKISSVTSSAAFTPTEAKTATLEGTATVASMTVPAGTTLTSTATLTVSGESTVNGTLTVNTNTLTVSGTSAKVTGTGTINGTAAPIVTVINGTLEKVTISQEDWTADANKYPIDVWNAGNVTISGITVLLKVVDASKEPGTHGIGVYNVKTETTVTLDKIHFGAVDNKSIATENLINIQKSGSGTFAGSVNVTGITIDSNVTQEATYGQLQVCSIDKVGELVKFDDSISLLRIAGACTITKDISVKDVVFRTGGTLAVNAEKTLTVTGSMNVTGALTNNGTIVNNGTITIKGSITNHGTLTNNGNIVITDGMLTTDGTVNGSGKVTTPLASKFVVEGGVLTGQTFGVNGNATEGWMISVMGTSVISNNIFNVGTLKEASAIWATVSGANVSISITGNVFNAIDTNAYHAIYAEVSTTDKLDLTGNTFTGKFSQCLVKLSVAGADVKLGTSYSADHPVAIDSAISHIQLNAGEGYKANKFSIEQSMLITNVDLRGFAELVLNADVTLNGEAKNYGNVTTTKITVPVGKTLTFSEGAAATDKLVISNAGTIELADATQIQCTYEGASTGVLKVNGSEEKIVEDDTAAGSELVISPETAGDIIAVKNAVKSVEVPKDKAVVIKDASGLEKIIIKGAGAEVQFDASQITKDTTVTNNSTGTSPGEMVIKAGFTGKVVVSYGSVIINGSEFAGEIYNASGKVVISGDIAEGMDLKIVATDNTTIIVEDGSGLEIPVGSTLKLVSTKTAKITMNNDGTISGNGTIDVNEYSKFYSANPVSVNFTGAGEIDIDDATEKVYLSGTYTSTNVYSATQEVIINGNLTIMSGAYIIINGGLKVLDGVTVTIQDGGMLEVISVTAYADIAGTIKSNGTMTGIPGFYVDDSVDGDVKISGSIIAAKAPTDDQTTVAIYGKVYLTGTLTVNIKAAAAFGELYVTDGGELINNGTISGYFYNESKVTINGKVADETTIYMYADDATVNIVSLTSGTLTINDLGAYLGKKDGKEQKVTEDNDNSITFAGIAGVVVTENIYSYTYEDNKYFVNETLLSGDATKAISTSDASITVTEGIATVAEELSLLKADMVVESDAKLSVSGTIYAVNTTDGYELTLKAGAKMTVTGLVRSTAIINSEDCINAVRFTSVLLATTYYNYTTLAAAIEAEAKDITVLGDLYVNENTTIPAGMAVDASKSEVYIGKAVIGEDDTSVILTIANGGNLIAKKIDVRGSLAIENADTGIACSNIISDTYTTDDVSELYTNITTALKNAGMGDVVKITNKDGKVVLSKNATVALGATLVIPASKELAIAKKITLTVEGAIENKGTISGAFAEEADDDHAAIALSGIGTIQSSTEMKFDNFHIPGAYFEYKALYCITTVVGAQAWIALAEDSTIDIRGTDMAFGDVAFGGTADVQAVINVHSNMISGTITLSDAKIVIDAGKTLDVTIAGAGGTIVFAGVKTSTGSTSTIETITDDDSETILTVTAGSFAKNDTTKLDDKAIKTTFDGIVMIDGEAKITLYKPSVKGVLGIASTVDITEAASVSGVLAIDEDVTVKMGSTLTVSGNMTVGHGSTVTVTGDITVTGSIIAAEKDEDGAKATVTTTAGTLTTGSNDYAGADAVISGDVTAAFYKVYDGTTFEGKIAETLTDLKDAGKYTEFYVHDALWFTYLYTSGKPTTKIVEVASTGEIKYNYQPKGLVDSVFSAWQKKDSSGKLVTITTATEVGGVKAVYALIDYNIYDVTIKTDAGIKSVSIDGIIMVNSLNNVFTLMDLAAGTHKVTYELKNGYSGTAVLSTSTGTILKDNSFALSGTEVTDFVFQLAGTEPTPEPEPVTPEEKSEWTVTTILLCVLVVLIAIMAVIVALRLNRN